MKSLFGRAVSFLLLPALIFLTFFRYFSGGVFLDCTPKYCKNGVSETADGYTDAEVLANGGALVKGSVTVQPFRNKRREQEIEKVKR
ncbi:MAG: hypothetical protein IJK33_07395 [Clostridia bacterium]|nr:hypothetical protein [Clostridia bacterium]